MLWFAGLLAIYLLVLLAIAWISFHPPRIPMWISPGSFEAPQEEIEFESDGNRLKGWWIEAPESTCVAICVHGYMMNKCELTPEAVHLWQYGMSCMAFDQRAHGKSGGKRCSFGYFERADVAAAVREAKRRKPGTRILLIGSSMGAAAIALALADEPNLADCVVLDSCYSRLPSASLGWWRYVGGKLLMVALAPTTLLAAPFAGFNPFRVDIARSLQSFDHIPILFLHGSMDDLALPKEAERNFAAYRGSMSIVWFEGCGHSEGRWLQPTRYREELDAFLVEVGLLDFHRSARPQFCDQ